MAGRAEGFTIMGQLQCQRRLVDVFRRFDFSWRTLAAALSFRLRGRAGSRLARNSNNIDGHHAHPCQSGMHVGIIYFLLDFLLRFSTVRGRCAG